MVESSHVKKLIYQGQLDKAKRIITTCNFEEQALFNAAILHDIGNFDQMITKAKSVMESENVEYKLEAMYWVAWGYYRKGNQVEARKIAEDAWEILNSIDNSQVTEIKILLLKVLGALEKEDGNIPQSLEYKQEQLLIAREYKDEFLIAQSINNLATLSYYVGNYNEALDLFLECYTLSKSLDYKYGILLSAVNAGEIFRRLGDPENALDYLNTSLEISKFYNQQYGLGYNYWILGKTYIDINRYDEAKDSLYTALELFSNIGNELHQAFVLYDLGKLKLLLGENPKLLIDLLYQILAQNQNIIIKHLTTGLEAISMKTSHSLYYKGQAMKQLELLASSDMVYFEITYDAVINYADLLIQQSIISEHQGSLEEAKFILDGLLLVTEKQGAIQKLIDVQILRSKLLMIDNQHEEANKILSELKDLANRKGLTGQQKIIEHEMHEQLKRIESLESSFITVSSFAKKIHASGIIDYLQSITKYKTNEAQNN